MTLRTVKKNFYFYHQSIREEWKKGIQKMFGETDSIEELKQEYDVGSDKPERLMEEIADDVEGEYVVWHDYNREFTQVMEVTH